MEHDQIPNKIYNLRLVLAPYVSQPLKIIFEMSISKRQFPSDWKKAIIVPIPKTNPPLINKLRTISLLLSPAKLLERLALKSIWQKS